VPDQLYPANFGNKPPEEPKKIPVACLLKTYEGLCQRTILIDQEYVFRDHEWAFRYYDTPNTPIRICSACREIYLKANPRE
jgi:hypothetical protein